jgi:hypothetical protein
MIRAVVGGEKLSNVVDRPRELGGVVLAIHLSPARLRRSRAA